MVPSCDPATCRRACAVSLSPRGVALVVVSAISVRGFERQLRRGRHLMDSTAVSVDQTVEALRKLRWRGGYPRISEVLPLSTVCDAQGARLTLWAIKDVLSSRRRARCVASSAPQWRRKSTRSSPVADHGADERSSRAALARRSLLESGTGFHPA